MEAWGFNSFWAGTDTQHRVWAPCEGCRFLRALEQFADGNMRRHDWGEVLRCEVRWTGDSVRWLCGGSTVQRWRNDLPAPKQSLAGGLAYSLVPGRDITAPIVLPAMSGYRYASAADFRTLLDGWASRFVSGSIDARSLSLLPLRAVCDN